MVEEKSIGAIPVNKKNEYLLLKRADKKEEYWEFPKGHQEPNETDMETLARELEEECSIKRYDIVGNFTAENRYTSSSTGNTRIMLFYIVHLKGSNIVLSVEHDAYLWLKFEDAMKKLQHASWHKILTDANTFLTGRK